MTDRKKVILKSFLEEQHKQSMSTAKKIFWLFLIGEHSFSLYHYNLPAQAEQHPIIFTSQ